MVKAKAKADRAAARVASQAALASAYLISADEPADMPSGAQTPAQAPEDLVPIAGPPPVADRTEMLRATPAVVARFMHLMVPILIDVYAASVITPVRVKTLTGLLKAVSFLDGDGLNGVLTVSVSASLLCHPLNIVTQFVPVASFASSILSSRDHPTLVIGALQLVDLLLTKVPTLYKPTFKREGVFHEIDALANRTVASSKRENKDKDTESLAEGALPPPPSAPVIPGYKKMNSVSLDPDDAITLRARVIRFKFLANDEQDDADSGLDTLKRLVEQISPDTESEQELTQALWQLAELFASPHTSVSSFELLQSGVVDALLKFATEPEGLG